MTKEKQVTPMANICHKNMTASLTRLMTLWPDLLNAEFSPLFVKQVLSDLLLLSASYSFSLLGNIGSSQLFPPQKIYPAELTDHDNLWFVLHNIGYHKLETAFIEMFGFGDKIKKKRGGGPRQGLRSFHFIIEPDGTPWSYIGLLSGAWHLIGHNKDSISIAFLQPEEFEGDKIVLTSEQVVSSIKLACLCRSAIGQNKFDPVRVIRAHQWDSRSLDFDLPCDQEIFGIAMTTDLLQKVREIFGEGLVRSRPNWRLTARAYDEVAEGVREFLVGTEFGKANPFEENYADEPYENLLRDDQAVLKRLLDCKGLKIGVYDQRMFDCVKTFQRMWNDWAQGHEELIAVDGIIGPVTSRCMVRYQKEAFF